MRSLTNNQVYDQTMICNNDAIYKFISMKAIFMQYLIHKNITSTPSLAKIPHYLQPLNDVPVIFGSRERRVPSGCVASRHSPIEDGLLYHIVGLHKQVVHLAVQIHRNGDRSALG